MQAVTLPIDARDLKLSPTISITIIEPKKDTNYILIVGAEHTNEPVEFGPDGTRNLTVHLTSAATYLVKMLRDNIHRSQLSTVLLDADLGLAARGHSVLNSIFHEGMRAKIDQTINACESEVPQIQINSESFIIPWEWLYQAPLSEMISEPSLIETMRPFWGVNRVVYRRRVTSSRDRLSHRRVVTISQIPCVGLIIDNSLEYARHEREFLRNLNAEGRIRLVELEFDPTITYSAAEKIRILNSFIADDSIEILHLACEAEFRIEDPLSSYFLVGDGFKYQLSHMSQHPVVERVSPFVFLNACSTAERDPFLTFDFVSRFQKLGARIVVAAESTIASSVAERFATEFYGRFLEYRDVGLAVHDAREVCIEKGTKASDVTALFYSLYYDCDSKIV